MAKMMLL